MCARSLTKWLHRGAHQSRQHFCCTTAEVKTHFISNEEEAFKSKQRTQQQPHRKWHRNHNSQLTCNSRRVTFAGINEIHLFFFYFPFFSRARLNPALSLSGPSFIRVTNFQTQEKRMWLAPTTATTTITTVISINIKRCPYAMRRETADREKSSAPHFIIIIILIL